MNAQVVAAAFEPPPLLVPVPPLPDLELPEPGFAPFAFGFAPAFGFAEPPDSPDLRSAAGLLAEPPESPEPEPEPDAASDPEPDPEPDPESEAEPEAESVDDADPDPPASTRAFESLRLSVR